jgi:hypothetical protein
VSEAPLGFFFSTAIRRSHLWWQYAGADKRGDDLLLVARDEFKDRLRLRLNSDGVLRRTINAKGRFVWKKERNHCGHQGFDALPAVH